MSSNSVFDPTTDEVVAEVAAEVVPLDNSVATKTKLSISLHDLYTPDCNCQCVNLAVLSNYSDNKEGITNFGSVNLPEIKINYNTFSKIFFNDVGKGFSPHILNKIWKGVKNFSLTSAVLEHFEKETGNDRDQILSLEKIQLHKECAIDKITSIMKKTYGLNQQEFNYALGSIEMREDNNICAKVTLSLFFDSLQVGIDVGIRFAVSDVPQELIGKVTSDEKIDFDFAPDETAVAEVSIVFNSLAAAAAAAAAV